MKDNLIQREKLLTVNLDDKQELSKVEITKVTFRDAFNHCLSDLLYCTGFSGHK